MTEERSRELICELVRDLRPVRPIPRLRTSMAAVLMLWLLVAAAGVAVRGWVPEAIEALAVDRGVGLVFGSLAVAGIAGLLAALALGIPGRERLARGALATGLLGLAFAAGCGMLLFLGSPAAEPGAPWVADLGCLGLACGVALLPALAVVWFVGRALAHQPLVVVLAAAAGAAALGALSAQASCPHGDARHLMVGHLLAPAVGAFLLTLPLLVALKRFARHGNPG